MSTDRPKVSFCTTLLTRKDDPIHDFRVRHYNDFIARFEQLKGRDRAELVIALWPCDDLEIPDWVKTTPMEGHFNVNGGHNASFEAASSQILFFCDTDLVLPLDAIDVLLSKVRKGVCFFPIWESLTEDKSKKIWRVHSFGNAAFHSLDFQAVGKLSAKQAVSWGGDRHVFDKAKKLLGLKVIREQWPGLWHQWHPKPARNFYNAVDDKTKYS